jgi:hypothetical protein
MWIVGTAIACCTATCRDPPGAAIFCKAVDSLGCARRRSPRQPLHHPSWHMVCTRLDPAIRRCETHQLPLHGPLFVQSAREKRQGLAVWPEGRTSGGNWELKPKRTHNLFSRSIRSPSFRRLEVGNVGLVCGTVGGCPACLSATAGIPQLTLLLIIPVPSHASVDQSQLAGPLLAPSYHPTLSSNFPALASRAPRASRFTSSFLGDF